MDAESAEEHIDLPEQSSESSSDDSLSETSESSCESYNVDEDESSEELSSEEETETASMVERAPTTPAEVPSNLAVVLGEGISQISESDYQTALASTSSADDVVNPVQGYDNISSHKSRNPGSLLLRFRECELIYTGGITVKLRLLVWDITLKFRLV